MWLIDWYHRRFGFWARNNRRITKNYIKTLESDGSSIDPELRAKINESIDEYRKPYSFGKNVVDNGEAGFDLLNELVRYLHTRFDDNEWNEEVVFNRLPTWYRDAYLAWSLDGEIQNGVLLSTLQIVQESTQLTQSKPLK